MRVDGTATVTPAMFRAMVKVMLGRLLPSLRVIGVTCVVVGLLVAFAADGASKDGRHFTVSDGVVFSVLGLFIAVWAPWHLTRAVLRRAAPLLAAPWRWEIDENTIRATIPIATAEYSWTTMKSFTEYAEFWLIGTPIKRDFLIVVKSAFSPTDQQLITELGRRRLAPEA